MSLKKRKDEEKKTSKDGVDVTASNKQEKDGEEVCAICQLELSERGEHIVSPILMKDNGNDIEGGDKC